MEKLKENPIKSVINSENNEDNNYVLVTEDIGNKNIKLIKFVNSKGEFKEFKEFNGEGFNERTRSCFFGSPLVFNGFIVIDDEVIFPDGYVCNMMYLPKLYEKNLEIDKLFIVDAIDTARERLNRRV